MVIILPKEHLPDAMALLERARSHGPHTEDLFKHEEFMRIAEALRETNPTLDNWRVLAITFREAARQLTSET